MTTLLEDVANRLVSEATKANGLMGTRVAEIVSDDGTPPVGFPTQPGWFGIWAPDGSGFRREAIEAEAVMWANLPTIPAKTSAKRVVLLGEPAAARGTCRRRPWGVLQPGADGSLCGLL